MENGIYESITSSPAFPWALSAITGLISFFAGNRAAIGRDRRIEYNAAADAIRARLIAGRGSLGPCLGAISEVDWDLMLRRSYPIQARRLRAAMKRAKEAEKQQGNPDAWGQVVFTDPDAMEAMREALIQLLPHR